MSKSQTASDPLWEAARAAWARREGFTLSIDGIPPFVERERYAVGVYGTEVPYDSQPTREEFTNYVTFHLGLLGTPSFFLGSWVHNGRISLEVAQVFSCRGTALVYAAAQEQKAIFDLKLGREIFLGEETEWRAA